MEPVQVGSTDQKSGTRAVVGAFAALYVLICLCLGGVGFLFRQQVPVVQGYFPSETPTPTATPVVRQPAAGDKVLRESFSNNGLTWGSMWDNANVAVNGGHMLVTGNNDNSIVMTTCLRCPTLGSRYYIEADFSTDRSVDKSFGIAFNISSKYSGFYLFDIYPQSQTYELFKTKRPGSVRLWMERISRTSFRIKPYPQVNKLGVYFDKENMEFYINGSLVDTYADPGTDLSSGGYAVYLQDPGYTLIVDNFLAFGK